MDKKSKILIAIFVVVILVSVFLVYRRAFIDQNFEIMSSDNSSEE